MTPAELDTWIDCCLQHIEDEDKMGDEEWLIRMDYLSQQVAIGLTDQGL